MITTIVSVASAVAALAGLLFRLERRMGDKLAEMERRMMERHVMRECDNVAQWLARIEGRMDSWFATQAKEVA